MLERAEYRNSDVGPNVVVGQDLAENARESRMRKKEEGRRVGRGKESERSRRTGEARGKKKARMHRGAEIKKREQAGGKNSRFGICVSEAVRRRRRRRRQQRRCTNVTRALREKKKSVKDTTEKSMFLFPSRLKMEVRRLERGEPIVSRPRN